MFSYSKRRGRGPERITPDRAAMTMDKAFLAAYSLKLIETCHRRGAFAMGGMSAAIPVKGNEAANATAFEKVRADKEREARNGHDGTWVAHPALVPVAMAALDRPNQTDTVTGRSGVPDAMRRLHNGPRHESARHVTHA